MTRPTHYTECAHCSRETTAHVIPQLAGDDPICWDCAWMIYCDAEFDDDNGPEDAEAAIRHAFRKEITR